MTEHETGARRSRPGEGTGTSTPEDRHRTDQRRGDALTLKQRRHDWLHNHVGEPLPAELREAPE